MKNGVFTENKTTYITILLKGFLSAMFTTLYGIFMRNILTTLSTYSTHTHTRRRFCVWGWVNLTICSDRLAPLQYMSFTVCLALIKTLCYVQVLSAVKGEINEPGCEKHWDY